MDESTAEQTTGKLHDLIERLQRLYSEHGDLDVYIGFPNVPNEGRMDAPLIEIELEHYDPSDSTDRAVMLWGHDPSPANAESITIDEFIRREAPNWEGKDAQAYIRNLRDGNESTLTEENRRLREALAWFADDKNWYGLPDPESGWFSPATVEGRGRARAALSPEAQP